MVLSDELKQFLYDCGADLVGIGDMSEVENCDYKTGIAVAVALPKKTIRDLQKAPTKEYYDLYYSLNKKLNEIVLTGEEFLKQRGFEAYAQTTDHVKVNSEKSLNYPIRPLQPEADLAGLGKTVCWSHLNMDQQSGFHHY